MLALGGLLVMGVLVVRRQPGALLIGIFTMTAVALVTGQAHLPEGSWWRLPRLETAGAADVTSASGYRRFR